MASPAAPTERRLGLLVVFAVFCLPLFIGLGASDLRGDEAIYSFGVDRSLETGTWAIPRSSPHEDAPFLEKPPLKIWLVTAAIASGLLPHNEFGLRFWDALAGSLVFVYVFLLGCRLAGAVCGITAACVLFVDVDVFTDALRRNNTDSLLILAVCAGTYHFLRWLDLYRAQAASPQQADGRAPVHATAVGVLFAIGFLTKFVAALFLPMILCATIVTTGARRDVLRAWRLWLAVALGAVLLVAPWFAYATWKHGAEFWRIIAGTHVYQRFSSGLDPAHIHPWHYYLSELAGRLWVAGSLPLVAVGLGLLSWRLVRHPDVDATAVAWWFTIPLVLLSLSTSKLYHYYFPFLPALALAAGLPVQFAANYVRQFLAGWSSGGSDDRPIASSAWLRAALFVASAALIGVAAISLQHGYMEIRYGQTLLLRSSQLSRPLGLLCVTGALLARRRHVAVSAVALLLVVALPLRAYDQRIDEISRVDRPMSESSACLAAVASDAGWHGVQLAESPVFSHSHNYYFRRLPASARVPLPSRDDVERALSDGRPVLIPATWSDANGFDAARLDAAAVRMEDMDLLLPAPYTSCVPRTARRGREPWEQVLPNSYSRAANPSLR